MTTLATADLHLSDNPRDAYRFEFLERTLPALVEEHAARRVIICGDLTETKDAHRAPLVNRVVDGLAAVAEIADVIVLKGNHDYVVADIPFYRFLQHVPRVRWINAPTRLKLRDLGHCLLLPHTRDLSDWVDFVFDDYDWFFCHQTFKGADLGRGHLAEGEAAPFVGRAGVVSGDVHVPQKIGLVTYVGSPYTVDFGDEFEPRVLLLRGNGKEREIKSITVPGPQKRLVEIGSLDRTDEIGLDLRPGDVVKARVLVGGVDLPALTRPYIRKLVHEWAAEREVALHAVEIVLPEGVGKSRRAKPRDTTQSDKELVQEYAKRMKKGRITVAAGLKIAEEVS